MIVPEEYPFLPQDQKVPLSPSGPWHAEPNFESWTDFLTGYRCAILRGPFGHLCGYVRVPQDHPAFGKDSDVEVHGGLTYRDAHGWFGFDCAHAGDLRPSIPRIGDTYRDWTYVKGQVTSLARQFNTLSPSWRYRLREARAALGEAVEGVSDSMKALDAESAEECLWLAVLQDAQANLEEVLGSLAANLPPDPTP